MRVLAEAESVEVRELSFASCPPLLDTSVSTSDGVLPHCREFNSRVVTGLEHSMHTGAQRKLGVMLVARWPGYLGTFTLPIRDRSQKYYDERRGDAAANLKVLKSGLRRTLASLTNLHARVVIMLGGPEFRNAPIRCLVFGYGTAACDQSLKEVESYRGTTSDTIRHVAEEFQDVRVLDPLPFFCHAGSCPAFIDGHPVDYDDNHLSLSSAKRLPLQ